MVLPLVTQETHLGKPDDHHTSHILTRIRTSVMNLACTILGLWCSISGPATAIDGDTLDIRGTRVRLWGIDAPELYEPGGDRAQSWLRNMVHGFMVTCYNTGERSHSRWVARCYLGDFMKADLAESLVRNGRALDCARYSSGYYRKFEPATARHQITQKPYC
jgi:micrococcal nuclease